MGLRPSSRGPGRHDACGRISAGIGARIRVPGTRRTSAVRTGRRRLAAVYCDCSSNFRSYEPPFLTSALRVDFALYCAGISSLANADRGPAIAGLARSRLPAELIDTL